FSQSGQVELSTTPFYHPILPLLIDPQEGRTANPTLPEYDLHFNWKEDAVSQLETALSFMQKIFGKIPAGIWPSEGSLSREVLEILDQLGIQWTATDETNLSQSLGVAINRDPHDHTVQNPGVLYRPYLLKNSVLKSSHTNNHSNIKIFFRDRVLSDLIGFHYREMPCEKAARDLVERLKRIPGSFSPDQQLVVPIILDGENAWEFYHNSGRDFLREFFQLVSHDDILETVTFSEALAADIEPGII
ncbi:MAG: glycoside hydrolase, partial [bacterium]|nr:glycoside hydrolase [bacterium]